MLPRKLLLLGVLSFPLSTLASNKVAGVVFWLVGMSGLCLTYWVRRTTASPIDATVAKKLGVLWVCCAMPLALNLVAVLTWNLKLSAVVWWPILLIPALVTAMWVARLQSAQIQWALALGIFVAALQEPLLVYFSSGAAPKYSTNWIVHATALWTWLILLVLAMRRSSEPPDRLLFLVLGLGLLIGLFMVGSRGPALVFPMVIFLLFPWLKPYWKLIGAGVFTACVLLAWLLSRVEVSPHVAGLLRLQHLFRDFNQGAVDGGTLKDSLGPRLEMARLAADLIVQRPWFGSGPFGFESYLKALASEGSLTLTPGFQHPHNTILSLLVSYGVFGLLWLVAAVILLLRWAKGICAGCASLICIYLVAWAVFGLTNEVFAHQANVRVFAYGLAVLITICLVTTPETQDKSSNFLATDVKN